MARYKPVIWIFFSSFNVDSNRLFVEIRKSRILLGSRRSGDIAFQQKMVDFVDDEAEEATNAEVAAEEAELDEEEEEDAFAAQSSSESSSDLEEEESEDEWDEPVEYVEEVSEERQEKTEKEIENWKIYYIKKPAMRHYLLQKLNADGKKTRRLTEFVDSLVEIANKKDDPEEVAKLLNKYYRWEMVFSTPLPAKTYINYAESDEESVSYYVKFVHLFLYQHLVLVPTFGTCTTIWYTRYLTVFLLLLVFSFLGKSDSVTSVASGGTATVTTSSSSASLSKQWKKGQKYVLYLKTKRGQWKPWLSLRPSTLTAGGIGLFAERQFEKNTPLGFYMGETIWRSDIEGGSKPTDDFLRKKGVNTDSPYDLIYLDNHCRMRLVRPLPLGSREESHRYLYMGLHYMNNACQTYADDKKREEAAKLNNALLIEDATVKCVKRILPNEEIFTGYDTGEHNHGCDRKPKAKDSNTKKKTPGQDTKPKAKNKKGAGTGKKAKGGKSGNKGSSGKTTKRARLVKMKDVVAKKKAK